MFAVFQSSGTTPESNNFSNIAVDIGAITFAISFSMLGLIWTGPGALWALRDFSSLSMPDYVILM